MREWAVVRAVGVEEGRRRFRRGDRVYHRTRSEYGTYIEPAARDTALVVLDSGRVDGLAVRGELSLDEVIEVTAEYLERSDGAL